MYIYMYVYMYITIICTYVNIKYSHTYTGVCTSHDIEEPVQVLSKLRVTPRSPAESRASVLSS